METKRQIGGGIYRLNETLAEVNDELMENGGELTPELEQRIASAELTQVEVVDGLQSLITKVKAEDAAIADEIKRLQALKKSRANGLEGLKRYLLSYMLNNGVERIEGAYCKVSVAAGRESVEVDENTVLENGTISSIIDVARKNLPSYVTLEAKVNKTALMQSLKSGEPVPGDVEIVRRPYLLIK